MDKYIVEKIILDTASIRNSGIHSEMREKYGIFCAVCRQTKKWLLFKYGAHEHGCVLHDRSNCDYCGSNFSRAWIDLNTYDEMEKYMYEANESAIKYLNNLKNNMKQKYTRKQVKLPKHQYRR